MPTSGLNRTTRFVSRCRLARLKATQCDLQEHAVSSEDGVSESDGHAIRSVSGQIIRDTIHLTQLDRLIVEHEAVKAALIVGRFEAIGVAKPELDLDDA